MSTPALILPLDYTSSSDAPIPSIVQSFGMGVESTAMLLRWVLEPSSRDFDLSDLAVCTSMVGEEFKVTGQAVSEHILPIMARERIRFLQIGRSQRKTTKAGGGVVVLDDSTTPNHLYIEGEYSLGQEMKEAGTIPQLGGMRSCSIHSKGNVLDPIIARITGGNPFRHAVGFATHEPARAQRDQLYNTDTRTGIYPLISWGWSREDCEDYIWDTLGVRWLKSCCSFCPYALSSAAGRAATVERWRDEPAAGVRALMLEHTARALNPAQTLIVGSSAAELAAGAGLAEVLHQFAAELDATAYSVYEVRRITRPARKAGSRGIVARSIRLVGTGSRAQMAGLLALQPGNREAGEDGITRHHVRRRGDDGVDHLYVSAPAGVEPKQRSGFEQWWAEATDDTVFCAS